MNNLIFDPLTGEATILATNRSKRVNQTGPVSSIASSSAVPADVDRFAKGNEHLTPPTLYQDDDDWNVRVFQNKYPLLDDHEIVVHSPDINLDIEDLPQEQNVRIIRAYLNRIAHHTSEGKEVIIFNNKGRTAGASINHPHSQIVAAKGFPGHLEMEKNASLQFYNKHEKTYWEFEVEEELRYQKRIIFNSPHFLLHVPYASRWSYEMRLTPKKSRPNMMFIDETEINDFSKMLKGALLAYDTMFNKPDRNFWIHTSMYDPYTWHVGFLPHIKVFGALEMGCGIWVSDKATSEDAASELREHFVYEN